MLWRYIEILFKTIQLAAPYLVGLGFFIFLMICIF
jgi:hypothetical protein